MTCDIILIPNPRIKKEIKEIKEVKNKERLKTENQVYLYQFWHSPSSMAQKARSTASASSTDPNGRNRENKYSSNQEPSTAIRRKKRENKEKFLYNRYKQGEKLL